MFPTGDLSRMQAAQEKHLGDVCHRSVYSVTTSDSGAEKPTWTENTTDIPCGIEQNAGSENINATDTVVVFDATIRLPLSQAELWDVKDKLILTKRFGTALNPKIVYGIAAPVQRGPSAIRILLKKVDV